MDFRRYYVPNSIVFITQVVQDRKPIFADRDCIDLLRSTLHIVQDLHPFSMMAYVFLPDHLHLLLKPTGDSNFSQIMHSLKPNFTKGYKQAIGVTGSPKFWQKSIWDHIIRDETDLQNHLNYIHYNPVKHRLVTRPEDWPHSILSYWKSRGAYLDGWGWSPPEFGDNMSWGE